MITWCSQLGLTLLALACCTAWCGCRPRGAGDDGRLVLLVSGDTAGWIVPCGCTTNQSGGLPRRAAYVAGLRAESSVIVADVGGAPGGNSAYDRQKFEAIARGEVALGIAAHNLGAAETALGAAELQEIAARTGLPLVSANVRDPEGELIAAPLRILAAGGRRIALVGVLSPQYAGGGLHAAAPRESVLAALREAAGRYDAVIVLAYLPEDELRQLAEALPEVDAVVGGPTGQPLPPKLFGPTLLISATRQGKFLARLDAPHQGAPGTWTGEIVELTERFADDPEQMENLSRFRADLAQRDFAPTDTSLSAPLPAVMPATFAVAGSETCRACHAEDCHAWDTSRHARAWQSLESKGAQADPDCQRCHTTGYGLPGGFVSVRRSAGRVQVGCENCHGPSQGHVRDERVHTAHFAEAKNHCTSCHDRENSPKFDYESYWPKIRHGDTPGTKSEEHR
jgi:hypothetical protein